MKKTTSLTWGVYFLIMSYTGIILYIAPHGRISKWLDWHFLGLNKTQYQEIHTTSMVIFFIFAILHIIYNWKPIVSYLKGINKKISFTKKEFLTAILINSIFVLGTLFHIQPVQGILDLGESIKESWGQKTTVSSSSKNTDTSSKVILPPPSQLGKKTLQELNDMGNIDLDRAIKILKSKGLEDIDEDSRMKPMANELDLTPTDIYKLITE